MGLYFMKVYWGGFMKKRISCKVLKSVPLHNEEVIYSDSDISILRKFSSFLNPLHVKLKPVIYTKSMNVERELPNNDLQGNVFDFYA